MTATQRRQMLAETLGGWIGSDDGERRPVGDVIEDIERIYGPITGTTAAIVAGNAAQAEAVDRER